MKKSILFILTGLFVMMLNSCSEDSKSGTTPTTTQGVTVKINGISKTFSKINVEEKPWNENGQSGVDLFITAANSSDPNEMIHLNIGQGDLGDDQVWGIYYTKDAIDYAQDDSEMKSFVDLNSEKRVKGSFNGSLKTEDGSTVYILTNGLFDVTYP